MESITRGSYHSPPGRREQRRRGWAEWMVSLEMIEMILIEAVAGAHRESADSAICCTRLTAISP